jgi:hypothetical protein
MTGYTYVGLVPKGTGYIIKDVIKSATRKKTAAINEIITNIGVCDSEKKIAKNGIESAINVAPITRVNNAMMNA